MTTIKPKPPSPAKIRKAREAAALTQTEAGDLVYVGVRTWQKWEADEGMPNHRAMHPAFFELFNIKAGK